MIGLSYLFSLEVPQYVAMYIAHFLLAFHWEFLQGRCVREAPSIDAWHVAPCFCNGCFESPAVRRGWLLLRCLALCLSNAAAALDEEPILIPQYRRELRNPLKDFYEVITHMTSIA